MKLDKDYLKGLLEAFEASDSPCTDIQELSQRGFSHHEDKFIFHLKILADKHLIVPDSSLTGLGYSTGLNGDVMWSVVPLRLTAYGHDLLDSFRQKEVWQTIKSEFQEAGLDTVISVSKQLAEGWAKKKVESLLNNDS